MRITDYFLNTVKKTINTSKYKGFCGVITKEYSEIVIKSDKQRETVQYTPARAVWNIYLSQHWL